MRSGLLVATVIAGMVSGAIGIMLGVEHYGAAILLFGMATFIAAQLIN